MAHRVSSPIFAGRATELAELVAAFERAADGAPGVVLVGGEAGIGKSRLLAELTAHLAGAGALVLHGQCAVLEDAAIPLLPVVDALSVLPGDRGDGDGAAGLLPAAARASPAGPASSELATGRVARLHARVLERIDRASASGPVLLALEDLHWADRSTLDLVAFLARRLRDERILVVGTHRSDEAEFRDGLRRFLADVGTAPIAQRVELVPLTLEETRQQVAGIVGAPRATRSSPRSSLPRRRTAPPGRCRRRCATPCSSASRPSIRTPGRLSGSPRPAVARCTTRCSPRRRASPSRS